MRRAADYRSQRIRAKIASVAAMTKLVDVRDLKSLAFGHAGSIPAGRTTETDPSVQPS